MRARCRLSLAGILLASLAACAGDYREAATAFHSVSTRTTQVISEQNDFVMRLGLEVRRDLAIEGPQRLTIPPGHCQTDGELGCQIHFRLKQSDTAEPLLPDTQPLQNTLTLARAIEAYAASLKGIALADTATSVRTAMAGAAGAVENLATTASTLGGSSAAATQTDYAQPVGAAFGWLFGQYVKEAQLSALRTATALAEGDNPETGPIAEAADLFAGALKKTKSAMRPILAQAVTERQQAFVNKPSTATFNAFVESAQSFHQLIKAKPSAIPGNFRSAHRKLHAALMANDIDSLASFFAVVEQIQAQAAELKSILQGLVALSGNVEETES